MPEDIAILEIEAETEGPIWFINHFLETTSSNYLKINTLRDICTSFARGARDRDFTIAAHSFELLPSAAGPHFDPDSLVKLESKDHSPENFWRLFKMLHRPVVLFREVPLFDPHSESALQLKGLTLNSPLGMTLQGAPGALIDLVSGKLFAQRDNERTTVAINNLQQIVSTSHLIENRDTPPGVRRFAQDQLEALMNKQNRINQKLGIRKSRVRLRPH